MPKTADELRAAARDSYVWGYPLVVMHRTRALHTSVTPLGRLYYMGQLATPADRTVVAPNNDTLYSSGWYDLRPGDLTIEVPPIDRYWSVMVLDAYTHVAYICRRTHGSGGVSVRVTLDPATEPLRPVADVLSAATPTVWILIRVLVDGPDDLDAARAIQRGISVTVPTTHPNHTMMRIGRPDQVNKAGAGFFAELSAALKSDPPAPWHLQPGDAVRDLLARWHDIGKEVLAAGVSDGDALISGDPLGSDRLGNGWGTNIAGSDFGSDLVLRARTAKYGLAAHHPVENRSYIARSDTTGARLEGSRPFRMRFAPGQPPCAGFWSLTVYGPDMFLVENEIGRYAIGDRTFGLHHDGDGSLPLIIGGPRPEDVRNWLPAPTGPYNLGLRVYEGSGEVVNATWFPPPLEPMQR